MNNASVTVDSTQVQRLLSALSGKETKQAIVITLRNSARILQKETESQFKRNVNLTGLKVKYKDKKRNVDRTKLKRVATIRIYQKQMKEIYAKVHIMADFRAKFFEMGTRFRRTKGHKLTGNYYTLREGGRKYRERTGKGGYRGRIQAGHFFRKAQELTERMIFDNMDKEMSAAIQRIAKRNGYT